MLIATCQDGRLLVEQGDITRCKVDAIVNAANSSLMGGGGVDGAIHGAGGHTILSECREIRRTRYPDGLPTGHAVITGAGRLPARHVIHTVGPVWSGGGRKEAELLAQAYAHSLRLASEQGLQSIAFPAISTGVYGYPRDLAARVAFAAVTGFLKDHELPATVHLVLFTESDARQFVAAVGQPPCR